MTVKSCAGSPLAQLDCPTQWAGTPMVLSCQAVKDHSPNLYPEELALLDRCAARRVNTFSTGRRCAHTVLQEMGVAPAPLLRNPDGSVVWPTGVIGSVSHTDDWAVAVGAESGQGPGSAKAMGVDLELITELSPKVLAMVATPSERDEITGDGQQPWQATALFSLKESLYKCLRPSFGQFIHFHDVQISLTGTAYPTVSIRNEALAVHCESKDLELRLSVTLDHVFSMVWWRYSS